VQSVRPVNVLLLAEVTTHEHACPSLDGSGM
jgi:hypothetical protein